MVSARHTATGHPVAVFGPQTGYFAPQLLMLQELQGPGISARGAAFAGLNLYVQLGRGQDYAWSATSAGQDITDTYAVTLCDPSGGTPTTAPAHYLYHGSLHADGEAGADQLLEAHHGRLHRRPARTDLRDLAHQVRPGAPGAARSAA